MKNILMLGVAAMLLSACASEPPAPAPPAPPTASEPAPPAPPPPEPDQCGAAEAQKFVGRSRSEIPVPVQPNLQRVACTTCAVTMDFNPRRLNFFFDDQTGVIKEVKCG
jgi:hypothetical protein